MEKILAKSNPYKELHEHTDEVLKRAQKEIAFLKSLNSEIEKDLENLKEAILVCCFAHDLGKVSKTFQASLKGKERYIPHNLLSVAILPSLLKEVRLPDDLREKIIYAVGFHHKNYIELNDFINGSKRSGKNGLEDELIDISENRLPFLEPMRSLFKKFFQKDVILNIDFTILDKLYEIIFNIKPFDTKLIYLKGILHRADHLASAEIKEDAKVYSEGEGYNKLIRQIKPKKFQEEIKSKNAAILIAPTGSGKTEGALCWAGSKRGKIIFTLPTRASVNGAFKRLEKYYGEDVGILHGEAGRFIYSALKKEYGEAEAIEESIHEITLNKNLMKPLIVATIDQIFQFALRVHQYEKILVGLVGSNIILDEIDSYSPYTIEILKQSLQIAKEFYITPLIMSATIPELLQEEFKKENIVSDIYIPAWDDLEMKSEVKHELIVVDKNIKECGEIVEELHRDSSILIVCNTVKKAVSVYEKLSTFNPKLYHSLFTFEDREKKEAEITKIDAGFKNTGIWITTQVVEVSLDLDFDVLITESAPINVLIQRMGRCYRKRHGIGKVFIYKKLLDENGKEMFFPYGDKNNWIAIKKSLEVIDKGGIIDVKNKKEMLNNYFETFWKDKKVEKEKEKAKNVISAFLNTDLTLLETIGDNEVSRFLRDSGISVSAVPQSELTQSEIDKLKGKYKWKDGVEKLVFINEIRNKIITVPLYGVLKWRTHFEETGYGLFITHLEYSSDTGLNLRELPSNFT